MAPPSDVRRCDWQSTFLLDNRLPDSYLATAAQFFDPLATYCSRRASTKAGTLLIAVNGSQGSGKSTGCDYLRLALAQDHGLTAIALSLDDFYLMRAERQTLAEQVHPLLATRGVPGTHDIELLSRTLQQLRDPRGGVVALPLFDKASDDRRPRDEWTEILAPVDVVVLEGWCLGARSQYESVLEQPVNALESDEDPGGVWRRFSNQQLRTRYESFYSQIDLWVMLAAPGFDQVLRWRKEQEDKLRVAVRGDGEGLMDDRQLERFVAHFERHTRQCLADLPSRVDVCFTLDSQRNIIDVRGLESVTG